MLGGVPGVFGGEFDELIPEISCTDGSALTEFRLPELRFS
jgi:hypothetical protein